MTIYAVYSSKGALVAYFASQVDAFAFIRDNHLYGHVELFTAASTFFTTGINATAIVDGGLAPFPA